MNSVSVVKKNLTFLYLSLFYLTSISCDAQSHESENPASFTLQQCLDFALKNQPRVRQSLLDEEITRKDINISLSGWLPQVGLEANLEHYLQLPVAFFPDLNNLSGPKIATTTGLTNTSAALFSVNQSIYSTDLAFAGRTVHDFRLLARQNTQNSEINSIVTVSRSFYDVILTIEQLDSWNEDIMRLQRSYEDAFHLFQNGLTDKIDYQQAQISLNNAKSQRRNTEETIRIKYSVLKQSMGFPPEQQLKIVYDSSSFEKNSLADTLERLSYDKRIEYQLMQTDLRLQKAEEGYYKWSFLPELSAFYDYNLNWANSEFSPLYNRSFPNSLIGLKLTLNIFQGTNRLQKLQKARLQEKRLEYAEDDLKSQISTQYVQALGIYKGNLYALRMTRENIQIAQEVFNTVSLQYNQGVKTYLDVIVAETELQSAKLNYLSALFQLLSSKLDLNAAMGDILVN